MYFPGALRNAANQAATVAGAAASAAVISGHHRGESVEETKGSQ
jgi:hypothetical protein